MSDLPASQIKVTLPNELYLHLKSKAEKIGLSAASYIRYLVIDDVKDIDIPTFRMNDNNEKIALKAIEDYKKGKTKKINNINTYFDSL